MLKYLPFVFRGVYIVIFIIVTAILFTVLIPFSFLNRVISLNKSILSGVFKNGFNF